MWCFIQLEFQLHVIFTNVHVLVKCEKYILLLMKLPNLVVLFWVILSEQIINI
jgi:hypothetical protein